ncbi:HARB1-like protein [Mya arenaria]|uniref:Putative nuclease HARBI1 n=1 Tax=Mya arenaria TaxID=6604 RepID=A0ABY7DP63_MYAAR|nr:HARB1-like protein [Mya arenaria]
MVGLRDQEVISRYRLSRPMINDLVHLIRADIDPKTNRGMGIDAETKRSARDATVVKVLLTLRYLAKGDFFSEVGDIHGVSKSSMSRHLHDVVLAINNRVDNIRFPEIDVERRSTATPFYRLSRIPRVLGAIDCTLISITTPTSHEASYVCRKGYHALNVQAVVDTKLRFIDAVARWPGATNDATIFEMSGLKDYLEANAVGVLLGDSGNALRNYLLTPILRPTANAQVAYNDAHARGRVVVERAFGMLKSRFRSLKVVMEVNISSSLTVTSLLADPCNSLDQRELRRDLQMAVLAATL